MRLLLVGAGLFLVSRGANAACVISGARPTVPLPTMAAGQDFSFVASTDCETLRFTIRGTDLSKNPMSGGPIGPGLHTYKVVLTESEWNAVVAESRSTLTWIVTGRTSAGEMTRMVTTNDLNRQTQFDLSMADARLVGENRGDLAGETASVVGDVNGDGNDDLFLGSFTNSEGGEDAGAAYLVLGPVTGRLDLSLADAKLLGEEPGDFAGHTAGAGDVDGDGNDDLLVGSGGHGPTGAAYVVLGPVSGTLDLSVADAKLVGKTFHDDDYVVGGSVSGAGDTDGDGHDDVLVGGVGDPYGVAYLVQGPITGTFNLGRADAELMLEVSYTDHAVVSGAGDVDGDGLDDLLIGAPNDLEVDAYAGAAYLVNGPVSGSVDLPSGATKLIETEDDAWYQVLGWSVSGAGDVDGDGNDDILIGVPGDDEDGAQAGAVYVVLGPGPGEGTYDLTRVGDAKLIGPTYYSGVGVSVAGAGDVDLDGLDDIFVGATPGIPNWPGGAYRVLSPVAGTVGLSRADIWFTSEPRLNNAGYSGGAGDVDGDGRPDLLISAPWDDQGGEDAGAAYLIYGGGL
jgi:hypothetical protein